jgi:hypothetical protein
MLSAAQSTQLTELQSGVKSSTLAMLRGMQNVPSAERRKKFDSFRSDLDRKVVLILDSAQRKRLHELDLQREGTRVLLKPDIAAELRITPEQQASLSAAVREEAAAVRDLYRNASKQITPAEQEEARKKITLIQLKTNNSIYDVLTNEQKTRFKVMQGAPFKFPERKAAPIRVTTPGKPVNLNVAPSPNSAAKPAPKK